MLLEVGLSLRHGESTTIEKIQIITKILSSQSRENQIRKAFCLRKAVLIGVCRKKKKLPRKIFGCRVFIIQYRLHFYPHLHSNQISTIFLQKPTLVIKSNRNLSPQAKVDFTYQVEVIPHFRLQLSQPIEVENIRLSRDLMNKENFRLDKDWSTFYSRFED